MKCHGCRGLGGTLHPDFALGAAPAEAESGKACHLVDEMHHRAFLQERVWNFKGAQKTEVELLVYFGD